MSQLIFFIMTNIQLCLRVFKHNLKTIKARFIKFGMWLHVSNM